MPPTSGRAIIRIVAARRYTAARGNKTIDDDDESTSPANDEDRDDAASPDARVGNPRRRPRRGRRRRLSPPSLLALVTSLGAYTPLCRSSRSGSPTEDQSDERASPGGRTEGNAPDPRPGAKREKERERVPKNLTSTPPPGGEAASGRSARVTCTICTLRTPGRRRQGQRVGGRREAWPNATDPKRAGGVGGKKKAQRECVARTTRGA